MYLLNSELFTTRLRHRNSGHRYSRSSCKLATADSSQQQRSTWARRNLIVALLVISAFAAPSPAIAQGVGSPAPDFTFTSLGGSEFSLSQFRGRVVFLFLFGNQCPYCLSVGNRTETEVNQVYSSSGMFQAIGLDLWDFSSSVSTVQAFRNQTGITYPLMLMAGSISTTYSTTYDRVIVVDKEGIIRYKASAPTSVALNDAKAVIDGLIGGSTAVGTDRDSGPTALRQNYPNPFSNATSISFTLASPASVSLEVFNILGQRVATLADDALGAGEHTAEWDGTDEAGEPLPSGIYFYSLTVRDNATSGPAGTGLRLSRTVTLIR